MKLGTLNVTSQEDDEKVIKSGGHQTAILGPFTKNRAQPKTRQKEKIFSMMQAVSHRI